MNLRFAVTPEMVAGAQAAAMRNVPWMRFATFFTALVFPILMVLLGLMYGRSPLQTLQANWGMMLGLPVFMLLGVPLLTKLTARRTYSSTPLLQGEHAYDFGPASFVMRTPSSTAELQWGAIVKAVETSTFFLLFQNKAAAHFIPKSAFTTAHEMDEFRFLLRAALGERAHIGS